MTDREKPGVAFWETMVLSLLVLYALSFGPACWATSRGIIEMWFTDHMYSPIIWISGHSPPAIHNGAQWYAEVGCSDDSDIPQMCPWGIEWWATAGQTRWLKPRSNRK